MTDDQVLLREALAEIRAMRHDLLACHAVSKLLAADLLFAHQERDPKHIVQIPTHTYSQNYEDAIIAEIYSRIGERTRTFVEIGIETGVECNTRALLERGWTGVWVDAYAPAIATAKANMAPLVETENNRGDGNYGQHRGNRISPCGWPYRLPLHRR